MQEFGFEYDPVPRFDPAAHGIDDSHCKNLRPKTEYRERETGRRLRFAPDKKALLGSRWEREEDGGWVPVESPHYVEHVLMDDDSDAAYYLHYMVMRYGERVSMKSVLKVDEPMRSALLHWSGLDRYDRSISNDTSFWLSGEYGLVVVWDQLWAYGVHWVSSEALEKAHERVRQLKAEGSWREPHPNGATAVFRM